MRGSASSRLLWSFCASHVADKREAEVRLQPVMPQVAFTSSPTTNQVTEDVTLIQACSIEIKNKSESIVSDDTVTPLRIGGSLGHCIL